MLSRLQRLDSARNTEMNETIALEKAERKIKEWQQKARVSRLLLTQAQQQIRELRLPAEPPEGAVVQFTKMFRGNPIRYRFVSHKAKGLWFTTGSTSPDAATWEQLVRFAERDNVGQVEFDRLYSSPPAQPF